MKDSRGGAGNEAITDAIDAALPSIAANHITTMITKIMDADPPLPLSLMTLRQRSSSHYNNDARMVAREAAVRRAMLHMSVIRSFIKDMKVSLSTSATVLASSRQTSQSSTSIHDSQLAAASASALIASFVPSLPLPVHRPLLTS
jgi:hypothetical protein